MNRTSFTTSLVVFLLLSAQTVSAQTEEVLEMEIQDVAVATDPMYMAAPTIPNGMMKPPPISARAAKPLQRPTNREIIEHARMLKEQQNAYDVNRLMTRPSSSTGKRMEIRMIKNQVSGTPGMPVRGAVQMMGQPMGSTSIPKGHMIRTIAASGSNAVFLREGYGSSSGTMIWREGVPPTFDGSMPQGIRFISTTSGEGFPAMPMMERVQRPQYSPFVNRIMNLFRARKAPTTETIEIIQ